MKIEEWTNLLSGREYCGELSKAEELKLKEDGFIVVIGQSDDLLDFRGYIHDEVGAWNGTKVKITSSYKIFDEDENKETFEFNSFQISNMNYVEAIWAPEDEKGDTWTSWHIRSNIFCKTFDIMEDGELYCRGIIFHKDSISKE